MKNFTTCICILGLSGVAAGDVLMDQIGDMDGSGLGANIMASQNFEAAYDIYDIVVADDFTGDGGNISGVEMVLGGWNGFVDPSSVAGYTANTYSNADAAGASLTGDIGSSYSDAADVSSSPDWMGANFLMSMNTEMASAAGSQLVGVMPDNDFATGGQTGVADSVLADAVGCIQANPAGGFGFGPWQAAPGAAAYRVNGGAPADPCSLPLPALCPADVDGDGNVAVSDVLAIIGSWGDCGDGTYRPYGDVAPLPNGDCCVTVADVLAVVGSWGADCTVYGACCYGDGMCDDASNAADCAAGGGEYFGDGAMCADNDCSTGACCISSTSCSDLTADACAGVGGMFHDGYDCASWDCSQATPGDECADAIVVSEGTTAFDTSNMTESLPAPDETQCPDGVMGWLPGTQDIWLAFVATQTTDYNINTCDAAGYDTSMAFYSDCGTQMACNGDSTSGMAGCQLYFSEVVVSLTAGETYIVRLGGWNNAFGTCNLNIVPVAPPEAGACCFPDETCLDNLDSIDCAAFGGSFAGGGTMCADGVCDAGAGDECADAITAYDGPNAFDTSLMTPSTPEPDDSLCAGTFLDWSGSADMWMAYTATGSGTCTFSACNSSYDTSMALYSDCGTQISCNGDASGESGCVTYYSAIYDWPVTEGETYIIRMGGWQGATGAGSVEITLTAEGAVAACCLSDGSCVENSSTECAALGGIWSNGSVCADVACWAGCPDGSEYDCDDCWNDGDDSAMDCNGGLNAPTPVYQAITLGVTMCGESSVFVDGPTGGTYRDLDWYDNAALNAGGTFTISVGSSQIDLLFGVVDLNAGAFVNAYVLPGGSTDSVSETLAAGNYAILCGAADWNVAWTCASGVDYTVQLD